MQCVLIFLTACPKKYDVEVKGRLLHPNLTPVVSQGLVLKGDNVFGTDNRRQLTDPTGSHRTDGNGEFGLFIKPPKNGKCHLNAVQLDGSLMQIFDDFFVKKGEVTDLGDIIVPW